MSCNNFKSPHWSLDFHLHLLMFLIILPGLHYLSRLKRPSQGTSLYQSLIRQGWFKRSGSYRKFVKSLWDRHFYYEEEFFWALSCPFCSSSDRKWWGKLWACPGASHRELRFWTHRACFWCAILQRATRRAEQPAYVAGTVKIREWIWSLQWWDLLWLGVPHQPHRWYSD